MKYGLLYKAIAKEFEVNPPISTIMISAIENWSRIYQDRAPWLNKDTKSAGVAAAVASEVARLMTFEMKSSVEGSKVIETAYIALLSQLRKYVEYGAAKGTLIIKPIATDDGIGTQFIQADRFFPLGFDGSGNVTDCVFTDRLIKGDTIYTLLERHSVSGNVLTIENRLYVSRTDGLLGSRVSLTAVDRWADLPEGPTKISGTAKLPFGMFKCPMANTIDSDSPMGMSCFGRAVEQIREADSRYSDESWEFEAKEAAVHISSAMLAFDKEQGKHVYPGGRKRLYRTLDVATGVNDKPMLDVYSPDIRCDAYSKGFNDQLRRIELSCSLAYGTLSDPQSVDKTATEILASKQRSYSYISECQHELENALNAWAEGALFWARLYGLESSSTVKLNYEWGDGVLSNPDAQREEDRKDLANGTLRPEEYRAKYRNETLDEALKNLPDTASVIE